MSAGLATERWLATAFLRSGRPRAALIASCTALVSGLLLVAVAVLGYDTDFGKVQEPVGNLVADSGLHGGYVFALGLICLAPLALLRQVVRLGSASREQRLAALRLAGATPDEVRRLGALEVGIPSLVGGLLGYVVYRGLGFLLDTLANPGLGLLSPDVAREVRLVPTATGPSWWQVLVVALGVCLIGTLAGRTTSRALEVTPHGVARRAPRSAPKPWGALLLAAAVPLMVAAYDSAASELAVIAAFACLALGLFMLAPWVAYLAGRLVAGWSVTVPMLVASQRLIADARPAGRAAAAVGVISVVAGGGGGFLAQVLWGGDGSGGLEAMYTVPVVMIGIVLLVALVLVVFSIAVHSVETLLESKRSTASLAAMGMSTDELAAVQRWEIGLVAMPMTVLGVLIGSGLFGFGIGAEGHAWVPLGVDLVTIALVWLAVQAASWVTRPWLHRAVSPENLRTA